MTVFRETSDVEVGETGSEGCIYLRNSGHIRGMTTTASGKSTENSFRVVVLISGSFLIIRFGKCVLALQEYNWNSIHLGPEMEVAKCATNFDIEHEVSR